jgi:hypothetical protein
MQNEALMGELLLRKNFRKLAEQLPDMFHALTISEAYFTGIIDNDASNMAARIKEKEQTVLNLLLELKTAVGAKQTTERKRSARKKSKQVYQ